MQTIREVILSYPGADAGSAFLETVLTDRSINGDVEYTTEAGKSVRLAVADIYAYIGGLPNFTEYKLSISYPRGWYLSKAKELYIANDEADRARGLGSRVPFGIAPQSW